MPTIKQSADQEQLMFTAVRSDDKKASTDTFNFLQKRLKHGIICSTECICKICWPSEFKTTFGPVDSDLFDSTYMYSESKKSPLRFSEFFPKRLGIFNQFFTHLLYDHLYTRVQIFIQISSTLTKLILHFTITLTSKFAY